MKQLLLVIVLAAISIICPAQKRQYFIKKTDDVIKLDGSLDEAAWQSAQVLGDFSQQFPQDSIPAISQTEVRLTYDDKYLYWSAKMYNQSDDREYVTPSLRRDFRGGSSDFVTITLDTYQDNTNAFNFGINPWGVLREGIISNGGTWPNNLSNDWDNKWVGDAKKYPGYWIAEGAIPFKTIRYKDGSKAWNFNVYRLDTESGERSTLTPIPQNYFLIALAFATELVWDIPLKKAGPNISLIPYSSVEINRDFEDVNENSAQSRVNFGGDAKIAVTPALNLDLTINPDFSQVEVDEQVTNLNRFELFFPEKRQFFLENADLFSSFGHPIYTRTFFSRRIGIKEDTIADENVPNKIIYGARLSGKLDNNWRIGFLNMQTERDERLLLPANNYTVGVVQRKIFARSNVAAMFTNRQSFDQSNESNGFTGDDFNRVFGVEYNIASADNQWVGKWVYQKSWDNNPEPEEYATSGWVGYRSRYIEWDWAHTFNGKNFNAEMGFVPRKGFFRIMPSFGLNFYPKSQNISQVKTNISNETFWVGDKKTDHRHQFRTNFNFSNTSNFSFNLRQEYTYLLDSFDPTNTDGEELQANTDYTYNFVGFEYSSDGRKAFSFRLSGIAGEYFNGNRYSLASTINMRFQPFAAIEFKANYNKIEVPAPLTSADIWLIGPRIDLTFSKKVFLASFLQFNSQAENFNINTRFQWRFKPVSDLFIVYTDNYATEDLNGDFAFQKKNRALVVKLTYWLNI